MNKKPIKAPFDPWPIRKSKLVLLKIQDGANPSFTAANRFYFYNDGQLDDKIIIGVQVHSGGEPQILGIYGDVPFQQQFGPSYSYFFSGIAPNTAGKFTTDFYISLCDFQERYWWNNQAVGSLYYGNCGKYIKRTYNRIKLDKCFVQTPAFTSFFSPVGNNSATFIPFTFYYIDQPKPV